MKKFFKVSLSELLLMDRRRKEWAREDAAEWRTWLRHAAVPQMIPVGLR